MGCVPTNCSSNIKSRNVENKCDIKDGRKKKKKKKTFKNILRLK
jgi:hypothetical protein